MAIEPDELKDALTVKQLAEVLQIGRRTANQWVNEGRIESIELGPRKRLITQRALTDYINSQRRKRRSA